MEKIYLLKNDKIMLGPYSVEKLKEKQVKPSDLIWYEGLADWTPAGNLFKIDSVDETKQASAPKPKFKLFSYLKRIFSFAK